MENSIKNTFSCFPSRKDKKCFHLKVSLSLNTCSPGFSHLDSKGAQPEMVESALSFSKRAKGQMLGQP